MTQAPLYGGWIVAIGLSTGGLPVLRRLLADLPPDFAAAVLVVQHIGAHRSMLAQTLQACCSLPARFARNGEPLQAGHIHVAPSDMHLLVDPATLRLSHGPKVNDTRPAIDPTLRSCALAHGPRVIGVVLSGRLDDGTAGLQAVKAYGGLAVVQDPGTAEATEMPMSALDHVGVDHCVAPDALGPLLARLVRAPLPAPLAEATTQRQRIAREQLATEGVNGMSFICTDTEPTLLTCPDCSGTLSRIRDSRPARFACHTGHVFSLGSLAHAQRVESEHVMRAAVRALREHAVLLREVEAQERMRGHRVQARQAGHRAAAALDQSNALLALADARLEDDEDLGPRGWSRRRSPETSRARAGFPPARARPHAARDGPAW